MTDEPTPTLLSRMQAAGISDERIEQHRAAGRVRLDGERVDDLSVPAPASARWTLAGS